MSQVPGSTLARRGGPLALALALVVAAGCGGGDSTAAPPTTQAPASTTPTSAQSGTTVARGAPRWETVTTLKGTGAALTDPFTIQADSIQWRARWSCDGPGQLRVTTDPPPRRPAPLIDDPCPGKGERFAIVTGNVRLQVEATGPWQVAVDQQVDAPLREPLLEGMAGAPVLRQGSFYNIDKMAKGTARIYQRPDGSRVLRLEDFEVSTNIDLFVWLSEAVAPKTTADAAAAGAPPHVVLGNLKSTLGNQNYVLPADLAPDRIKSIVIWCEPVRVVYGAAALS